MTTKYKFTDKGKSLFWRNRINGIWVLIPMFENNEDWRKNIPTINIELYGIKEIIADSPEMESRLILAMVKLNGLIHNEDFVFHRKTVFEVISLIEELRDFEQQ